MAKLKIYDHLGRQESDINADIWLTPSRQIAAGAFPSKRIELDLDPEELLKLFADLMEQAVNATQDLTLAEVARIMKEGPHGPESAHNL